MKKKSVFALIIFAITVSFCSPCFGKHLHPEKWYQAQWCKENNGVEEVVMPDGSRCDCLTEEFAVEFDFASKWAESIGQSLLYGSFTTKQPAIVLILESPKSDMKFLWRIERIIEYYKLPIKVFTIKVKKAKLK